MNKHHTLHQKLSKILNVENLDKSSNVENTESWDSFTHMEIISAIEEYTSTDIAIEDIPQFNSLKYIMQYADSKI